MSIYELKPWFREQLIGITRGLRSCGVTPNQITMTAIASSIAYGIAMIYHPTLFLLFPLFALYRMALNAMDGLMASKYDMKSRTGMWLNELGDIVSDFFLLIGFVAFIPFYYLAPIVSLTMLTEIIGFQNLLEGRPRHYQGPMGKSDRVFLLGILSLFIYFAGAVPAPHFIFPLFIILLLKTIYNRQR